MSKTAKTAAAPAAKTIVFSEGEQLGWKAASARAETSAVVWALLEAINAAGGDIDKLRDFKQVVPDEFPKDLGARYIALRDDYKCAEMARMHAYDDAPLVTVFTDAQKRDYIERARDAFAAANPKAQSLKDGQRRRDDNEERRKKSADKSWSRIIDDLLGKRQRAPRAPQGKDASKPEATAETTAEAQAEAQAEATAETSPTIKSEADLVHKIHARAVEDYALAVKKCAKLDSEYAKRVRAVVAAYHDAMKAIAEEFDAKA